MATSSVQICNSALVKVGAARIASLSDDTKAAKICNEQYDKLRKKLLRSHPWNFAIRRVALADTGVTPIWKYTNEFAIPSDTLRILDTNLNDQIEWVVESSVSGARVVLTNSASMSIQYVKNVTDTTLFPPDFEEALSFLIAADIAYSLTNSRSLARDMFTLYKAEIAEARSFDAQESSLNEVEANEWLDARF